MIVLAMTEIVSDYSRRVDIDPVCAVQQALLAIEETDGRRAR